MSGNPPKIVLISANPKDLEFVKVVAQKVGWDLTYYTDAKEMGPHLAKIDTKNTLFFVDGDTPEKYQNFENIIQEQVGIFSDEMDSNRLLYITGKHEFSDSRYLAISPLFGSLLVRNFQDLEVSSDISANYVRACMKPKIFGLKNFLDPDSEIQTMRLTRTSQKQDAVEAIKSFVVAAEFKGRTAALIANAADEVLMNAMFDAPVDEQGLQIYSKLPRDTDIELTGRSAVEMFVGFDGTVLGIAVVDFHGSIDHERLLEHLSKDYTSAEYSIKSTTASAGLGLNTVFKSGGNLVFASERGKRTEVTLLFRNLASFKDFRNQFSFLATHFYV